MTSIYQNSCMGPQSVTHLDVPVSRAQVAGQLEMQRNRLDHGPPSIHMTSVQHTSFWPIRSSVLCE